MPLLHRRTRASQNVHVGKRNSDLLYDLKYKVKWLVLSTLFTNYHGGEYIWQVYFRIKIKAKSD